MKLALIISFSLTLLLFITISHTFEIHDHDVDSDSSLWDLYERWRSHHTVSTSLEEKQRRFNVFKENVRHIHSVNKLDKPYKLKLNKFGDLTTHEFKTMFATSKIKHHRTLAGYRNNSTNFMYGDVVSVPSSVDWRKKGAVTPIKDQGQCGSCWAFSTIVSVEGINQIKTKKLVSLSEQELVDCDTYQNAGCNGGDMDLAFDFIVKKGGVTTEVNYPYTAKDGTCNMAKLNNPVVSIDGHEDVPVNDEDALKKAVAHQPVTVAIDAGGMAFQFYSEGVFTGECGTDLDHGVAVVGYGTTVDGTKYWIVKNSWGTEWGEKGYIRMLRDADTKGGLCGIAMEASYPIKKSSSNPGAGYGFEFKDEL